MPVVRRGHVDEVWGGIELADLEKSHPLGSTDAALMETVSIRPEGFLAEHERAVPHGLSIPWANTLCVEVVVAVDVEVTVEVDASVRQLVFLMKYPAPPPTGSTLSPTTLRSPLSSVR